MKTNKTPDIKAAYLTVMEHIDNDMTVLQGELTECELSETEPTCQAIATGAILRQLQKFRQKLYVRYSKL